MYTNDNSFEVRKLPRLSTQIYNDHTMDFSIDIKAQHLAKKNGKIIRYQFSIQRINEKA